MILDFSHNIKIRLAPLIFFLLRPYFAKRPELSQEKSGTMFFDRVVYRRGPRNHFVVVVVVVVVRTL